MVAERTRRQISELQSDAPGIVREAADGPVEITRYGETVAVIEAPERHREHEELDAALERAIWALDIQRALRNVKAGRYSTLEEVTSLLRTRYKGR